MGSCSQIAGSLRRSGAGAELAILALVSVVVAITAVMAVRDRLLSWLAAPWVVLAVVSGTNVWQFGNSAIRVFAPL